jgi:hypothetical protein
MTVNDKNIKKNREENIEIDINDNTSDMVSSGQDPKLSLEKLLIMEEITELLSSKNIYDSIKMFKADSEEKEIALEFINSHIQFLMGIVENDYRKKIIRSDAEIRDLLSHINLLLRKKDEYLFNTMIVNSPSHYKNVLDKLLAEHKKSEEGGKKKAEKP